ncbi:chitotriosidase-1-like isoform X2 [Ornithodoros turicata]|uniref:chitotriosidase-1-like isoform X2 n=1 Tax=Ornithodoros turicata TaxID=34597 RepID=UPI0031395274
METTTPVVRDRGTCQSWACRVFWLAGTPCIYTSYSAGEKVFLCYWGSWSHYMTGPGKFSVADIDPTLCTHLIYAFATLQDGEIAPYDTYLDTSSNSGLGMYKKFNQLKKSHPNLRTLIAIGGQNEGSAKYSNMSANAEGRKKFVDSVLKFLREYEFDGLDLNWEYPTTRGGVPEDRENHARLMSDLRAAFESHGYLLTASVSANAVIIDSAYNVSHLSNYVDYINVMCYDYFGSWNSKTGHNSPLRSREGGSEAEKKLNVEYSIRYWIDKGAESKKLVVGMPLYGRSFKLTNASDPGFGAPASGPGPKGPVLKTPGVAGYNEICKVLQEPGWKIRRDPNVLAPVAVRDTTWIGYDDELSLAAKAKFVNELGLAGAMVWAIEMDDFLGSCGELKNPLQTAIKSALKPSTATLAPQEQTPTTVFTKTASQDLTVPASPSTSTSIATDGTSSVEAPTTPGTPSLPCPKEGFYVHPDDPHRFYRCVKNGRSYDIYTFDCAPGTIFDEVEATCAFP